MNWDNFDDWCEKRGDQFFDVLFYLLCGLVLVGCVVKLWRLL